MAGGRVVGIDLGTTQSTVAYVDRAGQPVSVTNFEGKVLTPSAVLVEGKTITVGVEALKASITKADQFAECFKRYIGDEAFPVPVDRRDWRPEILSAMVLRKLRKDVQRQLGDVREAVITVPAYFDESRRRATRNAGMMGNWEVLDLINEPTAAALAYAYQMGNPEGSRGHKQRILVYDLGGGTFDTTILEIGDGEYRTLATEGDVQLGGHDWDQVLSELLAEQFEQKTGYRPLDTVTGIAEFLRLARKAKHALSERNQTSLPVSFAGKRAVLEVDRASFERRTAHLLARTRRTIIQVLDQARLTWQEIHRVLLIGGSTRMPAVRQMVFDLTGQEPDQTLSADEAVAQGAAIYAQLTQTDFPIHVVNITAHSYGIACRNVITKQREVLPLVPKNSPLPSQGSQMIPVQKGRGGDRASLRVYEGESKDPRSCVPIGVVQIDGLPPPGPKRWLLAVNLSCLGDGRIDVDAQLRDPAYAQIVQRVNATLVPDSGMTPTQVETNRRALDDYEIT